MSAYTWIETLVTAQGDGSALSNTTTATSLLPTAAKITLGAGFFTAAGKALRLKAAGRMSTAASTPGTFTFDVRFGSTVVVGSWVSGTLATSASNVTWDLEAMLVCRAIGSGTSATILGTGRLITAALSTSTPILLLPASSPAVGTGFDSTASQAVDFFGTWSAASASNTITLHQYSLEALN